MSKYVFLQDGGQASSGAQMFNSYVDQIISSQQQDSNYVQPDYTEIEPIEEESDYIKGLREYEEETSPEDMLNSKLETFMAAIDEKLSQISNQADEINWFEDVDGQEAVTNMYDTQEASNQAQAQQQAGSWPPPVALDFSETKPLFKSSGKQGLSGVGPRGLEIGNTVASMLGYTPTYNSVYRTKEQNDALIAAGKPAAKNSQHLYGNAVDVKPADWKRLTREQQNQLRSKYEIIYHDNHYHIEPK